MTNKLSLYMLFFGASFFSFFYASQETIENKSRNKEVVSRCDNCNPAPLTVLSASKYLKELDIVDQIKKDILQRQEFNDILETDNELQGFDFKSPLFHNLASMLGMKLSVQCNNFMQDLRKELLECVDTTMEEKNSESYNQDIRNLVYIEALKQVSFFLKKKTSVFDSGIQNCFFRGQIPKYITIEVLKTKKNKSYVQDSDFLDTLSVNHPLLGCCCGITQDLTSKTDKAKKLGICEKIKKINIYETPVTNISSELTAFKNLQHLFITNSCLDKIPEVIFSLAGLKTLCIFGAQLRKIDERISNLDHLKVVNFSKNMISKIPKSILLMKNLVECKVRDNPLEKLSKDKDADFYGLSHYEYQVLVNLPIVPYVLKKHDAVPFYQ